MVTIEQFVLYTLWLCFIPIYVYVFCLCYTEIDSLLVVLVTMVTDNGMLWTGCMCYDIL